jgi:hypothetical protein
MEKMGDFAGALVAYEKALESAPDDPILHILIAQAAYHLKRPERGLHAIQQLMSLDYPNKDMVELQSLKTTFEAMKRKSDNPERTLAFATAAQLLQGNSTKQDLLRARELIAPYVSDPNENDIELWKLAARIAAPLEDVSLAAFSLDAFSRIKPDYACDNDLLALAAQLNRFPVELRLKRIRESQERKNALANWRLEALRDKHKREVIESADEGRIDALAALKADGADLRSVLLDASEDRVSNGLRTTIDLAETKLKSFDNCKGAALRSISQISWTRRSARWTCL